MELGDRKRRILKAIINAYIETAEPVGSKSLLYREDLGFSPATLRSEMAELEELGYLFQPHISAGRIPSKNGYRFYVDELMPEHILTQKEKRFIERIFKTEGSRLEHLINRCAKLASDITGCVSIAVTPSTSGNTIKHFEIFSINTRCAAILAITCTGQTKTILFKLKSEASADDYIILNKILNAYMTGLEIKDIGDIRIYMLENEIDKYCPSFSGITAEIKELLKDISNVEINIAGENKVLTFPEFYDINKARALFSLLHKHDELIRLFSRANAQNINITIGLEDTTEELSDISLISSVYDFGGKNAYIAVLGPMRIDYAKVISDMKYFTGYLSRIIKETYDNDTEV